MHYTEFPRSLLAAVDPFLTAMLNGKPWSGHLANCHGFCGIGDLAKGIQGQEIALGWKGEGWQTT